jgi:hypothetical protein
MHAGALRLLLKDIGGVGDWYGNSFWLIIFPEGRARSRPFLICERKNRFVADWKLHNMMWKLAMIGRFAGYFKGKLGTCGS